MVKIYIDLGHGGVDGGANAYSLKEKNVVLKIGKKINDKLSKYENLELKFSRLTDKNVTLSSRTNEGNKWGADLFISIHVNAGGGTGFESFIHDSLSNDSETNKIRNVIHDEIMKLINVSDRGKKKANFHVLRETKMHAILTENMFIDNKSDNDKLKNDDFINKLATGHVNGIVTLYNLKKKKTVNKKDTYYRVITGSFKSRKNANARIKELKKKGFDSFIDIKK